MSRTAWAQSVAGDDDNVLPEDAPPQPEARAPSEEPEPRELPRKAKKPPAAPKVLRSRARVERAKAEAEAAAAAATEVPGAARFHLETPVLRSTT